MKPIRDFHNIYEFGVLALKTWLGSGQACPSCGCQRSVRVDTRPVYRRLAVIELRRCQGCGLMFRCPAATARENARFYESRYKEGPLTELPAAGALHVLVRRGFRSSEFDHARYVGVLEALGCRRGSALLDYGCSWGYGSWQLQEAGIAVTAFEISLSRCLYARDILKINAHSSLEGIKGPFDVFFARHVLEHVPAPRQVFELAFRVLKPGGLLVAITPNGSETYRSIDSETWHSSWGLVHVNLLDEIYYDREFRSSSRLFASAAYNAPYDLGALRGAPIQGGTRTELGLEGAELLFVARKEEHETRWCSERGHWRRGASVTG